MEKIGGKSITINIPITVGISEIEGEEDMVNLLSHKLSEVDNMVRDSHIFDVFDMNLSDSRLHIIDAIKENTTNYI
jgi:hypothetical protein